MAKIRVSTTVDAELWAAARAAHSGGTDASVLEAALAELLRQHRRAEIDAAYAAAYAEHPLSEPDAWGDLESWHEAAAAGRSAKAVPASPHAS